MECRLALAERTRVLAGAAALASFAAFVGFLAGSRRARSISDTATRRPAWRRPGKNTMICECGVHLPNCCSEEEVQRHKISARHKKNMLALSGGSEIIACEEVGEYRACALKLVGCEDYVLEVGCHVGASTKVIATVAKCVIGLDQKAMLVEEARRNLPNIQFEIGDAFDAQRILGLAKSIAPNRFCKVFVDISGSRDLATVIKLLDMYENTLKPDVLIVKSQALKRLLLRSHLWVEHPLNPQLENGDD